MTESSPESSQRVPIPKRENRLTQMNIYWRMSYSLTKTELREESLQEATFFLQESLSATPTYHRSLTSSKLFHFSFFRMYLF